MPYFSYNGISRDDASSNASISGIVEAPTKEAAAKLLRDKKIFVVRIDEKIEKANIQSVLAKFKRIGFSEIVTFTRQLSTMIAAGLQLPEALSIFKAQTENPRFQEVITDIEHQIVSGNNLADSLAKYPQHFSDIYVALVRAGEASGTLDQILLRMSDSLESQQEFRAKVKGAMIYPTIIVIAMIGVVFVMMVVVIPKLTELYRDFGATLPFTTQVLMNVSDFFVKFWYIMIAAMAGGVYAFKKWKKSVVGEFMYDSLILKIPLIGELQKKLILIEFTRTLGLLIGSGIHILDALKILRQSLANVLFRNAIYEVSLKIEKGFSIGETFSSHDIFPPIVSQMIKVGEETGKLDETLAKLSKYFQSESEHLVKGLTTAIEPLIMVVLGVGVGFIVISVITPIYNLTNQLK